MPVNIAADVVIRILRRISALPALTACFRVGDGTAVSVVNDPDKPQPTLRDNVHNAKRTITNPGEPAKCNQSNKES
jgi:hypothetical protein